LPHGARSGSGAPSTSAAALFDALGDVTRLALVDRLGRVGPASLARLTAGSGVSRQAMRKHLRVLERTGLARGEKRGRESLWRLCPSRLDEAHRALERISARWDRALDRLRTCVEQPE